MKFLSILKLTAISVFLFALVALPSQAADEAGTQTPFIQTLNPDAAKAGDSITAEGTFLGKSTVAELYLTKGGTDIKLEIKAQKAEQIVAVLPAKVAAGSYRLMVLTTGQAPRFIEQPVLLTVE